MMLSLTGNTASIAVLPISISLYIRRFVAVFAVSVVGVAAIAVVAAAVAFVVAAAVAVTFF